MADTITQTEPPVTADPAIQQAITDVASDVPAIIQDIKNKNIGGIVEGGEKAYQQIYPLAPTITQESKAGYKTTEFYLVIAYEALTQSGAIHLPGTWGKAVVGAAGIIAYVLSRGIAKSGVGNQVPLS